MAKRLTYENGEQETIDDYVMESVEEAFEVEDLFSHMKMMACFHMPPEYKGYEYEWIHEGVVDMYLDFYNYYKHDKKIKKEFNIRFRALVSTYECLHYYPKKKLMLDKSKWEP